MADSKFDKQLRDLLAQSGAKLVRNKNHAIYRLSNGQVIPMSQTPSDWRASRKRITALKHAMAKSQPEHGAKAPQHSLESSVPRKRVTQTNWPQSEPGQILLPKLELSKPEGTTYTPFGSVWELQQYLTEMDEFWALTPCGRAKVILKTLPANIHAEVVPMIFCRATVPEADEFFCSEDRIKLIELLMKRMRLTCGDGFYPALYLRDPDEGDLLVDVVSLSILEDVWEDIQIIDVEPSWGGFLITAPELSPVGEDDEPEEVDFIMAITPEAARKQKIHFMTDQGWTNPGAIRHVVEALRERHNPNYVPKPRPVVNEAQTPFEQICAAMLPQVQTQYKDEHLRETNWIVVQFCTKTESAIDDAKALNWVGRALAYSFIHEGRNMGRRLDDTTVELWFSFENDTDKNAFLEEIRGDGYCNPDEEVGGFHPPESLEPRGELTPAVGLFGSDQRARVLAVMELDPRVQEVMRKIVNIWKQNGNPMPSVNGNTIRWQ